MSRRVLQQYDLQDSQTTSTSTPTFVLSQPPTPPTQIIICSDDDSDIIPPPPRPQPVSLPPKANVPPPKKTAKALTAAVAKGMLYFPLARFEQAASRLRGAWRYAIFM